jgi:hypothetical protein
MSKVGAGGSRALGLVALVTGLCALTAGTATLRGAAGPPPDVGTVAPAATVAPAVIASEPPTHRRTPGLAPQPGVPTGVSIGALHVEAPVDPVGVDPGGSLHVPDDPERLGWWIGSAMPGAPGGTVLIAGHVDTAAAGPGALFRLEKLPMGARIDVRSGGRVASYQVVARRSYVKRRLPADLFRSDIEPRLVLVTCGGAFAHGRYSHNVVLYADPVGQPRAPA